MLVYLVRHAIAVPRDGVTAFDDASRELTDKGIDRMRRCVRGLDRVGAGFDEIWTSPLVRARQTADILAESPNFTGRSKVVNALAPGGDLNQVVRELQQNARVASVALVGHEPDMGELATLLTTGQAGSTFRFKKGGVACIEIDDLSPPLRGELLWMMTPKQMRSIS